MQAAYAHAVLRRSTDGATFAQGLLRGEAQEVGEPLSEGRILGQKLESPAFYFATSLAKDQSHIEYAEPLGIELKDTVYPLD